MVEDEIAPRRTGEKRFVSLMAHSFHDMFVHVYRPAHAFHGDNAQDTGSNSIPSRPSADRPPTAEGTGPRNIFGGAGGVQFTAGFGFFPSLFGLQFVR